ncbi:MAG: aldehyde dehydrogenase family protein, partial [Undibacterium sp.]|nr:aldehyde dehydrogenase family protein [Undibacterium sp.]
MTTTLWHERAAALKMDGRAFIDGQRRWAKSAQQFDNFSPVDGRKLGPVARCQSDDVDLAVVAARCAFDDGRWAGQAPAARKRVLIKFA